MFINLSNHPSDKWTAEQISAAKAMSEDIADYSFPVVDPAWSSSRIRLEAEKVAGEILQRYGSENLVIHVVGEFTLSYALIVLFKKAGVRCVASCSERMVVEQEDGSKVSRFSFVQFRDY